MKLAKRLSGEVKDTNSFHWNFEKFISGGGNSELYIGVNSPRRFPILSNVTKRKRFLFNNWAPCEYAQKSFKIPLLPINYENQFDKIFSICPYTVKWRNSIDVANRYEFVGYPLDIDYLDDFNFFDNRNREFDVIYHGGIHGRHHEEMMSIIKYFRYAYCTLSYSINALTRKYIPFATHVDLNYTDKLNLIASSKASICFNLCHTFPGQKEQIRKWERMLGGCNEAFSDLNSGIFPQFKTRFTEAAAVGTINLVYKDCWNVVENFFEKDVDFFYFSTYAELAELIDFVKSEWGGRRISEMRNSARMKARALSTREVCRFMESFE